MSRPYKVTPARQSNRYYESGIHLTLQCFSVRNRVQVIGEESMKEANLVIGPGSIGQALAGRISAGVHVLLARP
jgi:hypothetical protein